ncbi:MAG TPA: N-acetylmuramoyl-L-alanine amidase [Candidatus Acidoferrum sp.]|jgi:N-acetylmuramoyl-L-alanine amidase/type II secretory pathway predicted ATPase ExeA
MFLDFYQLREQPFGVTPDPAYLYPTRTHCEALDSLTEAILGDCGFLALIAEPGMGKTTLLYQVLDALHENARAVFLFQTQCNSREFFQYLMSELGVDSSGLGLVAMHNKLNEILFAEMLAGRRFVLIVDESQNLDESVLETIRLLSNFETPHSKLMQIVLAGQPQLREKLERKELAQLLQRITVLKHLEPLSPDETAGYIRHRLKVAGYHGDTLFEPPALAIVAELSHGIPRNINKLCARALLEGYAAGSQSISSDIVEKAAQRLQIVAAPCPKLIAMPKPPQSAALPAALSTDSPEVVSAPPAPAPQLTYQPPTPSRLPGWGIWAVALFAVLLTAGFALPRNAVKGITRLMRSEMTATKGRAAGPLDSSDPRTTPESGKGTPDMSSVTAINASSTGNDAQVVVMLDDAVQYESAHLTSPDRIYFDLHNARLGPAIMQKTVPAEDGLLKWVRAAQNSDGVVRLVLDADGANDFSAKLLSDPYRLVIDVHAQSSAAKNEPNSNSISPILAKTAMDTDPLRGGKLSLTRELGLKINRIAIDPGHGGYDIGTTGPHGLLEKNLCLDVALRLGELIEQNIPSAQVIYTRKDDRHVPLEERTAIANDANADLFISIHANSSDIRSTRGVETYYVSLAASEQSRDLATRENTLAESSLHNLPDLLKKITRNEKLAESKQLATDIQSALSQRLQLVSRQETNRGVKQAPFIVLTGANMPAVLSEISFVSNASDESLLLESGQRQQVAEGLFRGVVVYLDSLQSPLRPKQKLVSENHSTASAIRLESQPQK